MIYCLKLNRKFKHIHRQKIESKKNIKINKQFDLLVKKTQRNEINKTNGNE